MARKKIENYIITCSIKLPGDKDYTMRFSKLEEAIKIIEMETYFINEFMTRRRRLYNKGRHGPIVFCRIHDDVESPTPRGTYKQVFLLR